MVEITDQLLDEFRRLAKMLDMKSNCNIVTNCNACILNMKENVAYHAIENVFGRCIKNAIWQMAYKMSGKDPAEITFWKEGKEQEAL
jgi:hypothetical protein